MVGVNCRDLALSHVPSSLRTNIEVLELTFNRIREIHNSSFINYPYLKYLYLTDNSITHIDAGAFDPLSDLKLLDLTLNSLHVMPEAIENLPVLQTLRLGSNPLGDVVFTKTLPSIQFLSLSSCKLTKMPSFVALPGLVQLNMSDNKIKLIDVHEVAPMCRLNLLDLKGNPRLFRNEHCNCQVFVKWIQGRSIKLSPEPSSICNGTKEWGTPIIDSTVCFNNETDLLLEESERISRSCETEVAEYGSGPLRLKGSAVWALAAVCFCVVLLVSFFSLYFIRKRQTRNRNRDTVDNSSERLTHEKENQS